jgi:hypothetical protein
MFRKLVSNLPFNPSLITQFGFYADRLRQENAVRRFSFVFMAMAMVVQMLAVISPPEKSLAYSSNHIINGVRTKQDILNAYDNLNGDVKAIFTKFNLTRADIVALTDKPNTTVTSNDGSDWRTIGRTSLWNYGKVNDVYKRGEKQIQYRGEDTPATADDAYIYDRSLRAWDIVNPYNRYSAFKGVSKATGQEFWILVDCGNITWRGDWKNPPTPEPEPAPKKPELAIRKSITNNLDLVKPGDIFTYRIEYRNKVIGSVAENVVIKDQLDLTHYSVITPKDLNVSGTGLLIYPLGSLKGDSTYKYLDLTVRLKDPLPRDLKVCNGAKIEASNAATASTIADTCIHVITPCPYDPSVPNVNNPNCTEPVVFCRVIDSAIDLSTRTATLKSSVTSSNPANTEIKKYAYDFGDGTEANFNSSDISHSTTHVYTPGEHKASVIIYYRTTGQEQSTDKTTECSLTLSFEKDQPLSQSKTVKNITQNIEGAEAIKSKVRAGDILEYTLTTGNSQNYIRKNVSIVDYIGDILDYATLDLGSIETTGGKFNKEESKIIWENITIPANSEFKLSFRVQLLSPIPVTNRPSATSGDFDCQIDNTYGDLVSMSVQCPLVKGIESLPNTGPGTSIFAGSIITAVVGYFFARARLLSREIVLIRSDYATTGGM